MDLISKERELCYYIRDEQGSVRYVVDQSGNVVNEYQYSAFGETERAEERYKNRLCYNGQMYDGLTEQYYLRARYYQPKIGRFTQEDYLYGDGLNLYAYCKSNPVMYCDPSGLVGKPVINPACETKVKAEGESEPLDDAKYAQKTYSNTFSADGRKIYSDLVGESINTIDDLVNAINTGKVNVADLPVEYIVRDGNTLILNTRTSQALTQAGIPRSQWNAINRTGNSLFEEMLTGQLSRNKLTSEGISAVRPSGGN